MNANPGITRLEHPVSPRDFYLQYFTARQPVVIRFRDFAEIGWRTHLWTNDYLRYKAGAQTVMVQQRRRDEVFEPDNSGYGPMVFRDFLAQVMESPGGDNTRYLNLQNLMENRAIEPPALQLLGDYTIPYYFKDLLLRCVNLWMGNSTSPIVTPLHHDFNDNLYAVVEGRKQFVIFPPEQAHNLYVRGELLEIQTNGIMRYADLNNMPHVCRLDAMNVDRARFPLYAQAEKARIEFFLERNEMLFLPAGWFHQVSSLGRHIALSFFAETPPAEQLSWMHDRIAATPAAAS
ncbi:MAG TPA: cupin-like domain-containing protein [Gammaproteobacteria bacterium]|nr:cupin-like domain-containing protein [Gammaproteobacteria bacterium]